LDKNNDGKISLKEYLKVGKSSAKSKHRLLKLTHHRHLQRESFLKAILEQNLFKVYNENWVSISSNGFKIG